MELNREQIIKALEWCSELRLCVDCPMRAEGYFSHSGNACRKALMENALALIKELTEENALRTEENARLRVVADMSDATLTDALRIVNEFCDSRIKRANADTVRKMQGRLEDRIKNKLSYHGWYIKETVIPAVVEEILKETKI